MSLVNTMSITNTMPIVTVNNEVTRENSRKKFMNAKTLNEFLRLWSLFYENKIYTPDQLALFIGSRDNSQASIEMGRKFQRITAHGVICTDSQVTIPRRQKGYLEAYVPKSRCHELVELLNRYDGIVALSQHLRMWDNQYKLGPIVVTCNPSEGPSPTLSTSSSHRMMDGKATTRIYGTTDIEHPFMQEWLSPELQAILTSDNYMGVVAFAPGFDCPAEYIIDVFLNAVDNIFTDA